MKTFKDLSFDERKEIAPLLANWLRRYSDSVIKNIAQRIDEIISNEFSMNLLKELYERENKENEDFQHSLCNLFNNFDIFSEYDIYNYPLSHSQSYRDVLFDMYIKGI